MDLSAKVIPGFREHDKTKKREMGIRRENLLPIFGLDIQILIKLMGLRQLFIMGVTKANPGTTLTHPVEKRKLDFGLFQIFWF